MCVFTIMRDIFVSTTPFSALRVASPDGHGPFAVDKPHGSGLRSGPVDYHYLIHCTANSYLVYIRRASNPMSISCVDDTRRH